MSVAEGRDGLEQVTETAERRDVGGRGRGFFFVFVFEMRSFLERKEMRFDLVWCGLCEGFGAFGSVLNEAL